MNCNEEEERRKTTTEEGRNHNQGFGESDNFQQPRKTIKRAKVETTKRKAEEETENTNRYAALEIGG